MLSRTPAHAPRRHAEHRLALGFPERVALLARIPVAGPAADRALRRRERLGTDVTEHSLHVRFHKLECMPCFAAESAHVACDPRTHVAPRLALAGKSRTRAHAAHPSLLRRFEHRRVLPGTPEPYNRQQVGDRRGARTCGGVQRKGERLEELCPAHVGLHPLGIARGFCKRGVVVLARAGEEGRVGGAEAYDVEGAGGGERAQEEQQSLLRLLDLAFASTPSTH
mmetsp:Transcript_7863/g.18529  ORF Transcript_7863/g.18529 Transcript_7863/m.18529 type:complete len:224 (+) Transcript_7863:1374-2045(+)